MAPGEGFGASSSPNTNMLFYKPCCPQCLRSPGFVGVAWLQGYLQAGMLGEVSPKSSSLLHRSWCVPQGCGEVVFSRRR